MLHETPRGPQFTITGVSSTKRRKARLEMTIRPFADEDAEACFKMRNEAFIRLFGDELSIDDIYAGIIAYSPSDYLRMGAEMHAFVAVEADEPIGFCIMRILDQVSAELLLIYVRLDRLKQGIGSGLARHAEEWLLSHHPDISNLLLDTIIPLCNQGFYEKLGFSMTGETTCRFPGRNVRAVRLSKSLER